MSIESASFDRRLATWKKSSRSGGSGGNCVEVASAPDGGWAIRDSKDPDGPFLLFTLAEWTAFVSGVKDGEFRK
ncbi:DUF397 domain-containing protein [Actinoplanes derwentensis]|uniref:DUF397 domain-containing protein n=1 Tax=Actinoplanes derwentensis TaxID=113562 RepID=A0A1H1RZY0_9ACTN|nr:DUF397 domain-containing protein [Actinoplanes derwentensis]GID84567.1 hypothetical protein Ade03nite_34910 [Actinoplanes derwentensis]SDS41300.1 protein of unknown function [Actinoplanes derwentensis]